MLVMNQLGRPCSGDMPVRSCMPGETRSIVELLKTQHESWRLRPTGVALPRAWRLLLFAVVQSRPCVDERALSQLHGLAMPGLATRMARNECIGRPV